MTCYICAPGHRQGRSQREVRHEAKTTCFEAGEKTRLLAACERLETENRELRDRLGLLEKEQGWGVLRAQGEPFGTVIDTREVKK
jgi:hypothetical protein